MASMQAGRRWLDVNGGNDLRVSQIEHPGLMIIKGVPVKAAKRGINDGGHNRGVITAPSYCGRFAAALGPVTAGRAAFLRAVRRG
jgi:hypothetical protein